MQTVKVSVSEVKINVICVKDKRCLIDFNSGNLGRSDVVWHICTVDLGGLLLLSYLAVGSKQLWKRDETMRSQSALLKVCGEINPSNTDVSHIGAFADSLRFHWCKSSDVLNFPITLNCLTVYQNISLNLYSIAFLLIPHFVFQKYVLNLSNLISSFNWVMFKYSRNLKKSIG